MTNFTGPDWDAFLQDVADNLLPQLSETAVGVVLVPDSRTDTQFAVQLGYLVMMDKPIIAVIDPGVKVPAKLRAVADAIIIGNPKQPDFQGKFETAVRGILPRVGISPDLHKGLADD